jgi:hypothetical protein
MKRNQQYSLAPHSPASHPALSGRIERNQLAFFPGEMLKGGMRNPSFLFRGSIAFVLLTFLLAAVLLGTEAQAQESEPAPSAEGKPASPTPPRPPSKFREFNEVIRGLEKMDGLFTLYRTNDTLYAEIKPHQFEQLLIAPIAIARGMAMAGQPLNFGNEWILYFKRVGDRVQLVRRNIHYTAPKGSPLEKAVEQNYTDSVLLGIPIVSINPGGQGVLIDFGNIFLTDFANLRMGGLDRSRTTWHKVKNFQHNLELQVSATYSGRPGGFSFYGFGDSGVADSRGLTLVIHYSLARLPDGGYKPRYADHRVGHFISATKNFGSDNPDTPFVRQINRWRLEKADPKAAVSPPKRQLVWWVEDTVPHEFRPYVEEGILEWNKAFEKIGFRNAIGVRWQNERDDFDPEDINYCTFRWITTSTTFAMSGLRANPITGEIIDGDIVFDASWVRTWRNEYAFLVGGVPTAQEQDMPTPLAVAEVISPIMAVRYGFGLPFPLPGNRWSSFLQNTPEEKNIPFLVPTQWNPLQMELSRRFGNNLVAACQCVSLKQQEFSLAAISLAHSEEMSPDGRLPDEFLGQAIKSIVMHEVGHSLGLRHNFRASGMLDMDQLHDTSITRVKGLSGSVMDYNPINIARRGQTQGDYAMTTLGPYDYWAIEYAYKPINGDEAAELKKIASRSPEPDLAYSTDEDMWLSDDPYVNAFDLGSDPLRYGKERMALAKELMQDLDDKVVKEGEAWSRLRSAFSILLNQYGNAAYLASGFVGGHLISRDFKGTEGARDPNAPIPPERQREALEFLIQEVLSDEAFTFSPALLRRLTSENWYHWGSDSIFFFGGMDFPVYNRILAIQRIVLNRCFNPSVLTRLQNQELQFEEGTDPVSIAEVFQTLTEGIWTELKTPCPTTTQEEGPLRISTIRRNLQREHLQRLSNLALGQRRNPFEELYGYVVFSGGMGSLPPDARSLARLHLGNLGSQLDAVLINPDLEVEPTTRAHLVESHERINRVLKASLQAHE